jgi:hypothetical protein
MLAYQSLFQLTHRMTALVADIAKRLGAWKTANRGALLRELRRGNRICSLQASLAIADSLDDAIAAEVSVQTTVKTPAEKLERTPAAIPSTLRSQSELRYIGPKKGGHWEVL